MPDIFLDLRRIDYLSDQNVPVAAWRAYAEVLFTTATGALANFSCIVDSGAPFSVVPFSLWHGYDVKWNCIGKQLSPQGGGPVAGALKWQDVDCSLGVTHVHLSDPKTGTRTSSPFLVVAKFASQPSKYTQLETFAVLGMNFLADNNLRLVLDGTGADLAGYLSVP
jgi:hypothetical protein